MWKRKLYEYAGLQRLDFKGFPPLPEEGAANELRDSFAPSTPTSSAMEEEAKESGFAPASNGAVRPNARKQVTCTYMYAYTCVAGVCVCVAPLVCVRVAAFPQWNLAQLPAAAV
jgi:hypothetical protein